MEPRPLNKPQRSIPATPAPPPAIDRSSWAPPQASVPSAYPSPVVQPVSSFGGAAADPASTRGLWYDPAAPAAPPQGPIGPAGYSPGPALTPIDSGPIARIIGPLLALLVLAAVVAAVVFVVMRVFDGDDNRKDTAGLGAGTVTAVATKEPKEEATKATEESSSSDEKDGDAAADATKAPDEQKATEEATGEESPTPTEEPQPTSAPASALSLLPTTEDVPEGFKRTEKDKRTKDAVAASFPNIDEAMANLDAWEWKENAFITFEIPAEANPDPNSTTYINVSIHRFGDKASTKAALTYFADSVTTLQGLETIRVDRIGDQTIGLSGAPDGSNLVVLYVRTGNFLIRIGGSSPTGDPTQDVIDLANKIVN